MYHVTLFWNKSFMVNEMFQNLPYFWNMKSQVVLENHYFFSNEIGGRKICSGGPNRTEFTEYRSFGSVRSGNTEPNLFCYWFYQVGRYVTASFRVWSNRSAENCRITCNIVDETIIGVLFAGGLFRVHFFSRMDFKMWYI